jgi:AP endonuclease-1
MILETPAPEPDIWAEEIKLLYWMVGKDTNDPELMEREKVLQEKGREDREKQMDALKRKVDKAEKAAKSPRRKKKGQASESEDSESDEEHVH